MLFLLVYPGTESFEVVILNNQVRTQAEAELGRQKSLEAPTGGRWYHFYVSNSKYRHVICHFIGFLDAESIKSIRFKI